MTTIKMNISNTKAVIMKASTMARLAANLIRLCNISNHYSWIAKVLWMRAKEMKKS
jgi:hypothetical protein